MKKAIATLILFTFLGLATCCCQVKNDRKDTLRNVSSLRGQFKKHLKILDNVAAKSRVDTIYCCRASVNFLSDKTDIEPGTSGNVLGYFGFTKAALKQWHQWYRKKFKK